MKVYQVIETDWNGDEYDSENEEPLKTFLHEKAAEKYRDFKKSVKEFHYKAEYSRVGYYINTIEVCEDEDFQTPSISEFMMNKEKYM